MAISRDVQDNFSLACLARFRKVLEEGTLEQRKEFLRGFVAEIAIDRIVDEIAGSTDADLGLPDAEAVPEIKPEDSTSTPAPRPRSDRAPTSPRR